MLLDVARPLTQLNGAPLKNEKGEPALLGELVKQALLVEHADADGKPKRVSGEEKFKRYRLATKLEDAGALPADITVEEAKMIKELVGETYNALVVGQIYDIIEKAPASPQAKPKAVA